MARLKNRIGSIFGRGATPSAPLPLLSVVVPVHNVAPYLAECLDSILGQTLGELEVIAVDDGSTDGSPGILREYAARDPRVHVLTQANAGQGAARNAAMELVRGEFLTFADSDDVVPGDAYEAMVTTLRRTGSDLCVGAAQRFNHRRVLDVVWRDAVHDRDRLDTTLAEFPEALQDIIACNRVFRTAFWRERVPPFEAGTAYEDHVPMLAAYVRAQRFDLLAQVVYRWRIRSDSSSTSQQKASLRNLQDRIAVKEAARLMLEEEASRAVYAAWVARTIDIDFQQFLRFAHGADDTYRATLQRALQRMFGLADEAALARVRFAAKVRGWLAAEGDWEGLEAARDWFRDAGPLPPTRVVGDGLVARPDPAARFLQAVPERLWALAPYETPLAAVLRGALWSRDRLTVIGFAIVRGLSAAAQAPVTAGWLVSDSGERVELPLRVNADPWVDVWAADPSISYLHGRFEATIDPSVLAPGRWHLRLRIADGALVREDGVHSALDGSAITRLPQRATNGTSVSAGFGATGFAVTVATSQPASPAAPEQWLGVHRVDLVENRAVLLVESRGLRDDELAAARLQGDATAIGASSLEADGPDRWRLEFALTASRWGLSPTVVPRGGYQLLVGGSEGGSEHSSEGSLAAEPTGELAGHVPFAQVNADLRLTARMRANGSLALLVAPPLHDEERSEVGRRRLRSDPAGPVDEALVLLQCGPGETADGDPLALDRALARLRPDLRRVWATRSGNVAVPEGASSVTVGSAAWYDAVRTAGTLVTDDDLGEWFHRAPGQRWLQTLRGHPAKSMGARHGREQGVSPSRIEAQRRYRDAEWSTLLAPSAEAERLYRDELGYSGDILALGAPRTDLLLGSDAAERRADVRRSLGVPEGNAVLLYAPTYRDAPANRVRAAALPRDLDLAALEALPDTTVLLRAHPYDAAEAARWAQRAGVLDVTGYPHLADLLLAADVALLDYSAVRFDWALTGKPAIGFVPDLDAYLAQRAPLLPYAETVPGPLASTTAEVLGLLADPASLRALSAERAAAMVDRFGALNDGAVATRIVETLF